MTGVASGLSAATSRMLNERGAKVVGLDIAFIKTKTINSSILQQPSDVANEASLQTALAASRPVRILVACAGIAKNFHVLGRYGMMPLKHFRKLIDLYLVGTFNATRLVGEAARQLELVSNDGHRCVQLTPPPSLGWKASSARYPIPP